MQTLYGTTYVARHLGVSKSVIMGWVDRPTAAFPMPAANILWGDTPKQAEPAWTAEQLPMLRGWLSDRLHLGDPKSHWVIVDNGGVPPGGHLDQGALFGVDGT